MEPTDHDDELTPTRSHHQQSRIDADLEADALDDELLAMPLVDGFVEVDKQPLLTAKERSDQITARAVQLSRAFDTCNTTNQNRYVYSVQPPSKSDLKDQLQARGLPSKIYQLPYYSKDCDIPEGSKEYAGLVYNLKGGQGIATLEEWSTGESKKKSDDSKFGLDVVGIGGWEYASHPPSVKEVRISLVTFQADENRKRRLRSQVTNLMAHQDIFVDSSLKIEGPTQANIYGFKNSPIGAADNSREKANMTILSLEIFGKSAAVKYIRYADR